MYHKTKQTIIRKNNHPKLLSFIAPTGSAIRMWVEYYVHRQHPPPTSTTTTTTTTTSSSINSTTTHTKPLLIHGKYDFTCRVEPFPALLDAMHHLAQTLQQEHDPRLNAYLQQQLRTEMGQDLSMLTSLIPGLCYLLNDNDNSSEAHDELAQTERSTASSLKPYNRILFVSAVNFILLALLKYGRKVILFLENIHLANTNETLVLLIQNLHKHGLHVIVTVENGYEQAIDKIYSSLEKDDGRISCQTVTLPNLDENDLDSILACVFPMKEKDRYCLSRKLLELSKGVPLLILDYLRWMRTKHILTHSNDKTDWFFDETDMLLVQPPDALQVIRGTLSVDTEEVLKVASCLGPRVSAWELEAVLEFPPEQLLKKAVASGILVPCSENDSQYCFTDDMYQQAMYRLLTESNENLARLEIGRRLWRKSEIADLDGVIFKVLDHIAAGHSLVVRPQEKEAIAALALHASKKSILASAFPAASFFINFALSFLERRSWRDSYELTLSLHNAAAEIEMSCAKYERLDLIVRDVQANARSFSDTVRALHARLYSLGPRGKEIECLALGVEILNKLGVSFPKTSSTLKIMLARAKVQRLLRHKSDAQIERMDRVSDQRILDALLTLQFMSLNAYIAEPRMFPLIALKQMELTLTHGLSVLSPGVIAGYAMTHLAITGDYSGAYRFSKLGLKLLSTWGRHEHHPGTITSIYGGFWHWKRPFRECLEPLHRAFYVGVQTGDMTNAGICASIHCFISMESGTPLPTIRKYFNDYAKIMRFYRQESLLSFMLPTIQLIHHLMGLSNDPLATEGDLLNWDDYYKKMKEENEHMKCLEVTVNRMVICCYFRDFEIGKTCASECFEEVFKYPPTPNQVLTALFGSMIYLENARRGKEYRRAIKIANQSIKRLDKWSQLCPSNFLDKLSLLQAELASVQGKNELAFSKYVSAISLAKTNNFLPYIALSQEHLGRHLLRIGEREEALKPFTESLSAYTEWGADAKVRRLQNEISVLFRGMSRYDLSRFDLDEELYSKNL